MESNHEETELLLRTQTERLPELVVPTAESPSLVHQGAKVSSTSQCLSEVELFGDKPTTNPMAPLPKYHKDDPAVSSSLCRPMILMGVMIGVLGFLTILSATASRNLPVLTFPFGMPGLVSFGVIILAVALIFSIKLRSRLCAELVLGIFYPLSFLTSLFNIGSLRQLSLLGITAVCEATSDYRIAVSCCAEFIRRLEPFQNDSSSYAEYAKALIYSGRPGEAITWAVSQFNYFRFVTSKLRNEKTLAKLARSGHTLALVYELTGNDLRAQELRREISAITDTASGATESHLLGLLCLGEALFFERQYDQTLTTFRQFIQNVSSCRSISASSNLMPRAYTMLAIASAHTGDADGAWTYARAAERKLQEDFASYARVDEALLNAELHEVLGNTKMARQVLETAIGELPLDKAPLLLQRVENKLLSLTPLVLDQSAPVKSTVSTSANNQAAPKISAENQPSNEGSKTKPRVLPRFGRFATLVKMFLGFGVIAPLVNGRPVDLHFALTTFIVSAILLCLFRAKRNRSTLGLGKAISASEGQEVSIKFAFGSDPAVEVYDSNENFLGAFYANEGLVAQCQTLSAGQKVDATIYSGSDGNFNAIQILGYYSALKSSPMVPG